jgi:2-keto-4-pentenoate hydratase/2-oxohepta-3-ene-1,7-dioic acid hydratase in catechol pathway
MSRTVRPAQMRMLDPETTAARLVPLALSPRRIHAFGLTYAGHIRETGSLHRPDAPIIFDKSPASLLAPDERRVRVPSRSELRAALDGIESGLGARVAARFPALPALMDYEVELGLVALEDLAADDLARPGFAPPIGYFLANDLTARSVQVLGDGAPDELAHWGAAKSFPGFLPVGESMWVPEPPVDGCLRVTLATRVGGELRQSESTDQLVWSPREMLLHAARRDGGRLARGDVVLTGTPSGVAMAVPRWKRVLARLLLDRLGRLGAAIRTARTNRRFLVAGDVVEVDGGVLGRRAVELVGSD